MKIQLTPRETIQALRFGYHRKETQITETPVRTLNVSEISERQAEAVLINKVCTYISQLKTPIAALVSGGVDSSFMYRMVLDCFDSNKVISVGMNYPKANRNFEPQKWWIQDTLESINKDTYQNFFFSSSLISTMEMYSIASRYGLSILTGDGGDELFCGYDKYLLPDLFWNLSRRGKKLINYLAMGYEGTMTNPIDLNLCESGYPKTKRGRMLYDISEELKFIEIPKVETAMRMSGTDGIVCSPFLEKDVFDFCLSLPMLYKYRFGVRKVLLREILKKKGIKISHRKSGFAFPEKWIENELNWSLMVLDKLMKEGMVEIIGG